MSKNLILLDANSMNVCFTANKKEADFIFDGMDSKFT